MATYDDLFFPRLRRRPQYSVRTTHNGDAFYSYEYFREHFRAEIAEDCAMRCVYCDAHEMEVGGRESMEVDHFRPWSRTEFRHLRDDPTNFHHSCGRCNRLKASYWPAGGVAATHDGRAGFVDPFADDRREYFAVTSDGSLTCKKHPASYLVRLLQLNRPLLRMLRVRRMLRVEIHSYIDRMEKEFVASRDGAGLMTREELAIAALEVLEYHRLLDLCDWPLQRSVGC